MLFPPHRSIWHLCIYLLLNLLLLQSERLSITKDLLKGPFSDDIYVYLEGLR